MLPLPQQATSIEIQQAATKELLELLCTEIARDGNASLVTSLKDYVPISAKRLNVLLYHAIGKAKLLSFLEYHSGIFQVDRKATPHWVILASREFVLQKKLNAADCLKEGLTAVEKALSVLRKRQAKLHRRNRPTTRDTREVNIAWLLDKSASEFHIFLRASGAYYTSIYNNDNVDVKLVKSREWQDLVLGQFKLLLMEDKAMRFTVSQGKVCLSQLLKDQHRGSNETTETLQDDYLDRVEEALTKLVQQDGGHQVRLDILLHRHRGFKNLLGGRDLKFLIHEHPERFQHMNIRVEGPDLIFDSKLENRKGRMVVDEVGLYSVTNSKYGNAIGHIMVHCHRSMGWYKANAVDLTASVGGMTLGLAKTCYFEQITAVEIDTTRADLCRQNMKSHEVDHLVEVQNTDCMAAIPFLSKHTCIVIDPPWGGVGYKQSIEDLGNLPMDPWTFKQVLFKIYDHCTPCLVGMRLPMVNQQKIDSFLQELRNEGILFDTLSFRKLSVQRFAVLHFRE